MDYVNLGRTGLRISPYCLGTTNFGVHTSEPDSHAILDAALDKGLNFIDTADAYGYDKGRGLTETILGRWLAANPARRRNLVLATKVYTEMSADPNDRGLSAYHIKRACEDSLRRLQTDHIDLYQMHHIDRNTPWEETWQAMEQLVTEGKVTYIGSSNFAGWHIAQANERAISRHSLGLVSEQSLYNLASRQIELEVLPACEGYGMGFIPYSPTGGGLLAGPPPADAGRRGTDFRRKQRAERAEQIAAYESLCAELGQPPARIALAWLLQQPRVTAPIIGPRTSAQLDDALAALEIQLDTEALARLDTIFPGPGGEAPEAYAW